MINLLTETLESMREFERSPSDVAWVGTPEGDCVISWDEFSRMADQTYHEGYGGQEVRNDLIIVFNDGAWMERGEYDGSEWWEIKKTPVRHDFPSPLTFLFVRDAQSVNTLH